MQSMSFGAFSGRLSTIFYETCLWSTDIRRILVIPCSRSNIRPCTFFLHLLSPFSRPGELGSSCVVSHSTAAAAARLHIKLAISLAFTGDENLENGQWRSLFCLTKGIGGGGGASRRPGNFQGVLPARGVDLYPCQSHPDRVKRQEQPFYWIAEPRTDPFWRMHEN